jgi:MFS family permease
VLLITAGEAGRSLWTAIPFRNRTFFFTAASALCGFSQNVGELIENRIIEGVGGALTPQTLAIILHCSHQERRGCVRLVGAVAGLRPSPAPQPAARIITYMTGAGSSSSTSDRHRRSSSQPS